MKSKQKELTCSYCGEKTEFTDEDLKGFKINEIKGIKCKNENCESHNKEEEKYAFIFLPQGVTLKELKRQKEGVAYLSDVNLDDEDDEEIEEDELDIEDGEQSEESIHQVEL